MDGLTVTKICNILKKNLCNVKINNISLLEHTIYIDLNRVIFKQLVCVLANNSVAIYPSDSCIESGKAFKYLDNATITNISSRTFDRLLFLDLYKYKASGKKITYRLVFELVSKSSNFFILDESGKIIYMLNPDFMERDRALEPGRLYKPFSENSLNTLLNGVSAPFEKMLGFYVRTAQHANVLLESGFSKNTVCDMILNSLDDEVFYIDEKNYLIPFKIRDYKSTISFFDLADFYNNNLFVKVYEQKKKKILAFLGKQKDAKDELLCGLKENYRQALNASIYEQEAELLKNNYSYLKDKKGEVLIKKYVFDGVLDETIYVSEEGSLKKNMEALFKKSKKLKKSKNIVEKRIKNISDEINELSCLIDKIDSTLSFEEIDLYYNMYFRSKRLRQKEYRVEFYTFSFKDVKYLVGRSNLSNDELTFHSAKQNDMWFHAKDIAGAHVIAKKNGPLDNDEIVFGARLAASFSRWKRENKVSTVYTLKKYINKPKGTPAGYVIYKNYKTVDVQPFGEKDLKLLHN